MFFFSIRFWINQTTGLIYTKSFLDREKQSVYYLTVEARDGGEKVSSASVKVDIIDVNDNRPIFMQPKYEFGITENSTLMSGMDNISVHVSYQLFTKKKLIKSVGFVFVFGQWLTGTIKTWFAWNNINN